MNSTSIRRVAVFLILSACSPIQGKRDCLVKAIGFQDAYNNDSRFDQYRWSRVRGIFWDDKRKMGHAVHVYRFGDKIMVQGSGEKKGGWTLSKDLSLMTEPLQLANLYAPGTAVREAYFFEDL